MGFKRLSVLFAARSIRGLVNSFFWCYEQVIYIFLCVFLSWKGMAEVLQGHFNLIVYYIQIGFFIKKNQFFLIKNH